MSRQAAVKVVGAKGPASLGTGRTLLSKISKRRGVSGHRIPTDSHKAAIKQDLLENGFNFGRSLPSLMESMDTDGLYLLDDGLHLTEVLEEIEADALSHSDAIEIHPSLKDIFQNGMPHEWVKWEDSGCLFFHIVRILIALCVCSSIFALTSRPKNIKYQPMSYRCY